MSDYTYLIRRKFFKLFGAAFHIYDPQGQLIGFSNQKAFKLKEDIRVYTDESMSKELLFIQARHVIDFSASYDVYDSATGQHLGIWQRKGIMSLVRDNWILFDPQGNQIGEIKEDSLLLALVRRFIINLLPQDYSLNYGPQNTPVASFSQCFNPFIFKMKVIVPPNCPLLPQLVLAGGILLSAIEGRQG
ncbi:MAG: hypothetical protein IKR81_00285 [Victivallales bacterium]|nr:hypothetical protein [Victivallales bacterium]